MALLETNLNGRTIRMLGASRLITPAVNSITYPVFIVGDVKNRAPEGDTFVAFVVIEYDGSAPPGTLTLRLGKSSTISTSGDWKNTFNADDYVPNPSVIYASDQQSAYANGETFAVRVVQGVGGGRTMTVRAYGWTE